VGLHIIKLAKDRSKGLFYGWWIVAAGFCTNAFGVGTFYYGFSTFFNPMIEEFKCSRALMSGVYSLARLEGGIEGPLAGWLIDRFGARKMMQIGITTVGIGYMMLYLVKGPLSLYLIFGLVLSLGYNLGYTHAAGAAIAKWFIRKRGRALSILISGNGIGGAIFVPLLAWLITMFGWRWAAVVIGLATFAIPLPLSLLVRSTPEEMGLSPDGESQKSDNRYTQRIQNSKEFSVTGSFSEEVDFTVREALGTRAFWVYVSAMMLRSCLLGAIVVHQIPHLTDIGIPYQTASGILGLMVLMSVPGRFIFGWLGDMINKQVLLFFLCLLQGAGLIIFINAYTVQLLYLYVIVFGLGYGGVVPNVIALRADLFGRRNYATIAGITMTMSMIGTVAAPVFAGHLFDITHTYKIAFYILSATIVLSGISFLIIPRPSR